MLKPWTYFAFGRWRTWTDGWGPTPARTAHFGQWPCRSGIRSSKQVSPGLHGPSVVNERAAVETCQSLCRVTSLLQTSSPVRFPAAAAYSTQPLGHGWHVNCPYGGSAVPLLGRKVAALRRTNENRISNCMRDPVECRNGIGHVRLGVMRGRNCAPLACSTGHRSEAQIASYEHLRC